MVSKQSSVRPQYVTGLFHWSLTTKTLDSLSSMHNNFIIWLFHKINKPPFRLRVLVYSDWLLLKMILCEPGSTYMFYISCLFVCFNNNNGGYLCGKKIDKCLWPMLLNIYSNEMSRSMIWCTRCLNCLINLSKDNETSNENQKFRGCS